MIRILKIILVFLSLTISFYLLLTLPTWFAKLAFKVKGTRAENTAYLQPTAETAIAIPTTENTSQPKYRFPKNLADNELFIPKINLKAPVNWNVATDDQSLLTSLRTGLAHFQNTALPGENGNVFLAGHSSYYWWDKGKFKRIFSLLPALANNDIIYLKFKNQPFIYQVIEKITVAPENISVIDQTAEPILSLMTCVPIGTNLQRLVVRAKQLYPTESATKKIYQTDLKQMPKAL